MQMAACVLAIALPVRSSAADDSQSPRRLISLDGTWQIAEGSLDQQPQIFNRTVPVPGLADMAKPAFAEVGTPKSGQHRKAFWYRRTFSLDRPVPAAARLKFFKAKYGTKVWLNGKLVGEHLPCFTPAEFDVHALLKGPGGGNDLVVRVGAHRDVLPKGMPDGFDFEKISYIPGIYDSVELILSGTPRVANVQAVPDLEAKTVRVVAEIDGAGAVGDSKVVCRVREAASGKLAGEVEVPLPAGQQGRKVDVRVPIRDCRFWSPEEPFLYELEVSTGADALRTRFGMRSFRFDAKTGRGVLNGKPHFLRGTNVCVYRFFEDPTRGDRPWREEWVRRLHRAFRSMHWNSIRYCIGFPPEMWYRIADEEGLMIQDEFPVWQGGQWPAELKSDALVKEYTEWMRERWNHPCVIIWDAQNESVTTETGKAIKALRHLDLSNRPWDNGYGQPQSPSDSYEAHP
jgi:beta-galactosidase/beta-glucuronidase